jgi:hypothetical protein
VVRGTRGGLKVAERGGDAKASLWMKIQKGVNFNPNIDTFVLAFSISSTTIKTRRISPDFIRVVVDEFCLTYDGGAIMEMVMTVDQEHVLAFDSDDILKSL